MAAVLSCSLEIRDIADPEDEWLKRKMQTKKNYPKQTKGTWEMSRRNYDRRKINWFVIESECKHREMIWQNRWVDFVRHLFCVVYSSICFNPNFMSLWYYSDKVTIFMTEKSNSQCSNPKVHCNLITSKEVLKEHEGVFIHRLITTRSEQQLLGCKRKSEIMNEWKSLIFSMLQRRMFQKHSAQNIEQVWQLKRHWKAFHFWEP